MNQLDAYKSVIEALQAIDHFRHLPIEELLAGLRNRHPDLWFNLWVHPDFKGWHCGREGRQRLDDLTTIALARDESARLTLHPETVSRAIEWQLCDRFLKKQQPITAENVDSMIKRAINHALKKRTDECIAIPCRVTHDAHPSTFEIGDIQFVRTEEFVSQLRSKGLSHDDQQTLEIPDFASSLERNPWVALATFRGMDPLLGRERAQMAVQAALELLAALMDPGRGDRLVPATASEYPEATLYFTRDTNETWTVSWSRQVLQTTFGEDWYKYLMSEDLRPFLKAGGKAVAGLLQPRRAYPLEQRFLDGLHWFGLACRERSPASRIIACVIALERLSMTREVNDQGMIAKTFAQRSVVLAKEFAGLTTVLWHPDFLTLYNIRSRLAHGDISPMDTAIPVSSDFALVATRAALLGSLAAYAKLSKGLGSDDDLQVHFGQVAPLDSQKLML